MLADYPGTLLIVSHDRDFLDRVATSVIAFEGNAKWTEYAGGLLRHGGAARLRRRRRADLGGEGEASAQAGRRAGCIQIAPAPHLRRPACPKTSPARIEALSTEIHRLEAALSDPDFYRRDPAAFAAAGKALETARVELAATEEEWLRLELLREEIEGG
jgi:ATP-binding cassette subfamily F protein uup